MLQWAGIGGDPLAIQYNEPYQVRIYWGRSFPAHAAKNGSGALPAPWPDSHPFRGSV